jgi:hypothetical protein
MRMARMAGSRQANTATPINPTATAANVKGSIELTWNSRLRNSLVAGFQTRRFDTGYHHRHLLKLLVKRGHIGILGTGCL